MVTIEQVRLLESRVAKAIDYVNRQTEENGRLTEENNLLKSRLDSYQKRIDELEGLILRFREDQSRIEEGIIGALDRPNQFEEAVERSLGTEQNGQPQMPPENERADDSSVAEAAEPEAALEQVDAQEERVTSDGFTPNIPVSTLGVEPSVDAEELPAPASGGTERVDASVKPDAEAEDEDDQAGDAELDIF
jgi:hypothetical protein